MTPFTNQDLTALARELVELPEEKRRLLEVLFEEEGIDVRSLPIPPRKPGSMAPLSHAQARFWNLWLLTPELPCDNVAIMFQLRGRLDLEAMRVAVNQLLARHEILRTVYSSDEKGLVQRVLAAPETCLRVDDLSSSPEMDTVMERARSEARLPFNLREDLPFRARVFSLSDDEQALLLVTHHMAADGWSARVLLRELAALYAAAVSGDASSLDPLPVQYADYALWQRTIMSGDRLQPQRAFWKEQLKGAPGSLRFPQAEANPASAMSMRGSTRRFELGRELTAALKARNREEGKTLFMLALAALQVLLHRMTGAEDVVVGTPVSNRSSRETENMAGNFANNLLLRSSLGGNPSLREALDQSGKCTAEAFAHQDLPLEQLIDALREEEGSVPRLQVMLILRDSDHVQEFQLPGIEISELSVDMDSVRLDLTLDLIDGPDGLVACLEYKPDLFSGDDIDVFVKNLVVILEQLADDPDRRIDEVELPGEWAAASPASVPAPAFESAGDEVEESLSQIWTRILRRKEISIHDNFFDVGGYSLLAVSLFQEIETVFGRSLPLATLFEAPSIAGLAAVLRGERKEASWSVVVPIQSGGTHPPFFCVHGAGGNVLLYRDLARCLGTDQPFYGLQSRGLDGSDVCHDRIEDMAADYVREMRQVQPKGPYYLGGYCMGGTIAFEMARQLSGVGERVALLALFDTYASYAGENHLTAWQKMYRYMEKVWFHSANLACIGFVGQKAFVSEKWKESKRRLRSFP